MYVQTSATPDYMMGCGEEMLETQLRATAEKTSSVYNSPVRIAHIHRLISQRLLSPEVEEAAIKYGASSERLVNDLQVAYDRWKDHPGALFAFDYGEVIANKPLS